MAYFLAEARLKARLYGALIPPVAISGVEARTLQSQVSLLRFLKCTVGTNAQVAITRAVRTPPPLNPSQMSSDTEDSVVSERLPYAKRKLLAKHSNKTAEQRKVTEEME